MGRLQMLDLARPGLAVLAARSVSDSLGNGSLLALAAVYRLSVRSVGFGISRGGSASRILRLR